MNKSKKNVDYTLVFGGWRDPSPFEGIPRTPLILGKAAQDLDRKIIEQEEKCPIAATLDNATAFGLSSELGSIEVGKRADLLLLKQNPLGNISANDSIKTIFRNGEPIARETLRPHQQRVLHDSIHGTRKQSRLINRQYVG